MVFQIAGIQPDPFHVGTATNHFLRWIACLFYAIFGNLKAFNELLIQMSRAFNNRVKVRASENGATHTEWTRHHHEDRYMKRCTGRCAVGATGEKPRDCMFVRCIMFSHLIAFECLIALQAKCTRA